MDISVAPAIRVTLSIGVASSSGPGGYGLSELLSGADAALYIAKDRGRAQVVSLEQEALGTPFPAIAQQRFGDWQVRGV